MSFNSKRLPCFRSPQAKGAFFCANLRVADFPAAKGVAPFARVFA
jgi:hypothetical protein